MAFSANDWNDANMFGASSMNGADRRPTFQSFALKAWWPGSTVHLFRSFLFFLYYEAKKSDTMISSLIASDNNIKFYDNNKWIKNHRILAQAFSANDWNDANKFGASFLNGECWSMTNISIIRIESLMTTCWKNHTVENSCCSRLKSLILILWIIRFDFCLF